MCIHDELLIERHRPVELERRIRQGYGPRRGDGGGPRNRRGPPELSTQGEPVNAPPPATVKGRGPEILAPDAQLWPFDVRRGLKRHMSARDLEQQETVKRIRPSVSVTFRRSSSCRPKGILESGNVSMVTFRAVHRECAGVGLRTIIAIRGPIVARLIIPLASVVPSCQPHWLFEPTIN